ncbi:MAG: DUF3570 domain-containing protein [Prolixibacteraceae bacterium]
MKKLTIITSLIFFVLTGLGQEENKNTDTTAYKSRVLESTEIDILTSYYSQEGDNAAVGGGMGTEELTDFTPTIVVSVPLNDDDVLTLDAGISSYTSASSSNINPFDGDQEADPFQASSGASRADLYTNVSGSFSHSSDDRNKIWSAKLSFSNEFDYRSLGFGGSLTRLFNEKNTEINISGNVYLDKWKLLYPVELRHLAGQDEEQEPGEDEEDDEDEGVPWELMTGNLNYNPSFTPFKDDSRNSYSVGMVFSQILSKRLQGSLSLDLVVQDGLLSTPYHRIYFADVANSFIENFQLADDVERLPDTRLKAALGGRLNYFINETLALRTYYRYYADDWGISSHTASIEIPIKLSGKFTLYPSYRFYTQTAADYFAPRELHVSTEKYYTSDYDLSEFKANQYGFGISYTDIMTRAHLWKLNMKSIDLKFHKYDRDSSFSAWMGSFGIKFIIGDL